MLLALLVLMDDGATMDGTLSPGPKGMSDA
jgi:hypothetical protein